MNLSSHLSRDGCRKGTEESTEGVCGESGMGDVHRGKDIRLDVQEDALRAALIEHIKRRKRRRNMDPVKAVDGKKTTIGTVLTLIGIAGVALGLSGEEIDELKSIVGDAETLYVAVVGVIVSAVGLAHKIIKVAAPLVEWFYDWSDRRAMK